MTDVNQVWLHLLATLLATGKPHAPRNEQTLELLGYQTIIPMESPVVTVTARKLGRKFLAAEAAWILSGDNRVSSIAPFSKEIVKFSDDGLTFNGAYGPRFVDQVGYVVRSLARDPETRQAVLTTWRERPSASVDVPCTVALQFILRDGRLHCMVTMRSSDCWLGIVYDWHAFSMMASYVLLSLRCQGGVAPFWKDVTLGDLYLTAGSQHLYLRNRELAEACLKTPTDLGKPYPPYPLDSFNGPDDLIASLWERARA